MCVIISLFNHKGGVSKTTTTFNLGWALAEQGRRVLLVDGDPQCNLTGTILNFGGNVDFEDFYNNQPEANIHTCLSPAFNGSQEPLNPTDMFSTRQKGLYLLAGHIDLAESEAQLAVSLRTGSAMPALQNLPGAITHLLRITGMKNNIDVILIDMSPSIGALNECFLMGSDYFIVPTSPDYYCNQAIESLRRTIPRWNEEIRLFRSSSIKYRLPENPPKFCGIISQRYRPYSGAPAASFQGWIDTINTTVNNNLAPTLREIGMLIPSEVFNSAEIDGPMYNLINISDFNSLIAQSQRHNTPVFALTDSQLNQHGVVLDRMSTNRDMFRQNFERLSRAIISLTSI